MDEVLVRRLVGLLTLVVVAFLLSWLLPRPGLQRLQAEGERVVTMDLTQPDSQPEEVLAGEPAAVVEPVAPPPAPAESAAPIWQNAPAETEARDAEGLARAERPAATPAPAPVAAAPKPVPPPAEHAKPVPKPEPEAKPKTEPKPAVATATKPAAQEAASSSPAPTSTTPAKPAVTPKSGGAVNVQAGAYSFLDKAEGVRDRAQAAGVACVISPAETAKGTLYRVRCGPFAGKDRATAAVQTLKAKGIAAQIVSGG